MQAQLVKIVIMKLIHPYSYSWKENHFQNAQMEFWGLKFCQSQVTNAILYNHVYFDCQI
jgi:hypothetical protein